MTIRPQLASISQLEVCQKTFFIWFFLTPFWPLLYWWKWSRVAHVIRQFKKYTSRQVLWDNFSMVKQFMPSWKQITSLFLEYPGHGARVVPGPPSRKFGWGSHIPNSPNLVQTWPNLGNASVFVNIHIVSWLYESTFFKSMFYKFHFYKSPLYKICVF